MSAPPPERFGVEVLSPDGRPMRQERAGLVAGQRWVIGRGLHCDLWLTDPYCAAEHAELYLDAESQLCIRDLGSRNGTWVNEAKLAAGESMRLEGAQVRLGQSRLTVLRAGEDLAQERSLLGPDEAHEDSSSRPHSVNLSAVAPRDPESNRVPNHPPHVPPSAAHPRWHLGPWLQTLEPRWAKLAALFSLFAALGLGFQVWQGAERDGLSAWATRLMGASVLIGMWVFFWALLTRLMKGAWRWAAHTTVILATAILGVVFQFASDLLRFSFALPPLSAIVLGMVGLIGALGLYLHLRIASPMGAKRAWLIGLGIPLLGLGGSQWLDARSSGRSVNRIDSYERLFPPALRARTGEPVAEFFKDLSLESDATTKAKIGQSDDEDDEGLDFSD